MAEHRKVVVIGAGASGLVTLKTMKQLGIDCLVFEANSYHGGLWHFNPNTYGVMEFTHINVSRYNYAFSDFPFPDEGPEFAHHRAISDYFDRYVEHFNLAEDIQYRTRVVKVTKSEGSELENEGVVKKWTLVCEKDGEQFSTTCEHLVIATGHHAKPKVPNFPGEEKFKGEIIHSVTYKDVMRSGYQGKNVVLIGIGNSCVDIADNLVGRGGCPKVHISTRSGSWVMPNYWFGYPGDLHLDRMGSDASPKFNDVFLKAMLLCFQGHPTRWGLNPKHEPSQAHPTVSPTLIHHIQRGRVKVSPDIQEIGEDFVKFEDGSIAHDVSVIIKCTGYTIHLPYLEKEVRDVILDEQANDLKMYHVVFSPNFGTSLAMIGYIQPIGSLISMSEIQAQWLGMLIKGECSLPSANEMKEKIVKDKMKQSHYRKSTRHTIQRVVIPYCDEIAAYFGAKPRPLDHPWLAHKLLFSSGGVAQWTLQGPYYNPKAKEYVAKVPIPPFNIISKVVINVLLLYLVFAFFSFLLRLCF